MVGWLLGGPFERARVLPRNDESSDRAVSEREHLFFFDRRDGPNILVTVFLCAQSLTTVFVSVTRDVARVLSSCTAYELQFGDDAGNLVSKQWNQAKS